MNAIKDYMTPSSHAIGHDQTLKLAQERMHQWKVGHLPVLARGVLVGVLSERDIALLGAIAPKQADGTTVEEAMSTEPYAVEPDTDAGIVTAHMAEHKAGCAVVMQNKKVLGVFTSSEALSLLTSLLHAGAGAVAMQGKDFARAPTKITAATPAAAAKTAVAKAPAPKTKVASKKPVPVAKAAPKSPKAAPRKAAKKAKAAPAPQPARKASKKTKARGK